MEIQLVSFETAKLAKEKGFDWKVLHHYKDGFTYTKELIFGGSLYNMNCPEEQKLWHTMLYSAPPQSLLQKWLRDIHNIHVWLIPAEIDKTYRAWIGHGIKLDLLETKFLDSHISYEKSLESGLYEALKLIKP